MRTSFFFLSLGLLLWACNADPDMPSSPTSETYPLTVSWELLENHLDEASGFSARFNIQNTGDTPLGADWAIYYSQTPRKVRSETIREGFNIEQISGDWFRLEPTNPDFQLAPGASVAIAYTSDFWIIKEAEAPAGVYIVAGDEAAMAVDFSIVPFDRVNQSTRGAGDKTPYPSAAHLYEQYASLSLLGADEVPLIIPRPQQLQKDSGSISLDTEAPIFYTAELEAEANYLQESLQDLMGEKPGLTTTDAAQAQIILRLNPNLRQAAEAYELNTLSSGKVEISSASKAGIFYGIQSLRALISPADYEAKPKTISLPIVQISDAPRFPYRGVHLDVSRNFHSKASVLKLLELMAFYKLNKLHFHLTDDEGWRLAIPGLPELTEIGSKRGHTLDEKDRLHPSYGSGPDMNSAGSGHYSREDYIEILRFAKARHIEIIPEFDLPGHARAAIISMKARYDRLQAAGNLAEAEMYLLADLADSSAYRSVQDYNDNVISVCRESTYHFLEKVVTEVKAMYSEAGLELKTLHTGGDEVPKGVWLQSPDCIQLIEQNPELKAPSPAQQKDLLTTYFLQRFHAILQKQGIQTAGWEEIAMRRVKDTNGSLVWKPNPEFTDDNFLAYVWNNLSGAQDWAYQLANAGYDVVLCDVTNLYFDLAYDKSPQEPGLYWGGFVDTRKVFEFIPHDVFKSTDVDAMGNSLPLEDYRQSDMVKLQTKALQHVKGIQGQLWSETVRDDQMMEYYLFPKLLGLAERAWANQPAWAEIEDTPAREQALDQDWNIFANALGQRELKRLNNWEDGVNFRVPPPGAVIEDGKLMVRNAFPGLAIRFTTDGSAPEYQSAIYNEPFDLDPDMDIKQVQIRAFDAKGRGSRVVKVE